MQAGELCALLPKAWQTAQDPKGQPKISAAIIQSDRQTFSGFNDLPLIGRISIVLSGLSELECPKCVHDGWLPVCMQAYKNYIKKLLTRTNTINGRKYSDDPTILSLELVNEFRTTDNYEIKRGLLPGSIIQGWIREVTAYIRTLDTNHMVGLFINL